MVISKDRHHRAVGLREKWAGRLLGTRLCGCPLLGGAAVVRWVSAAGGEGILLAIGDCRRDPMEGLLRSRRWEVTRAGTDGKGFPSFRRRSGSLGDKEAATVSVVVPVPVVFGVAVTVVDVVDVVTVRDADMSAAFTVLVFVAVVARVVGWLALVRVIAVRAVEVSVVHVVGVGLVRESDMPAGWPVLVRMVGVRGVCGGHDRLPFPQTGARLGVVTTPIVRLRAGRRTVTPELHSG